MSMITPCRRTPTTPHCLALLRSQTVPFIGCMYIYAHVLGMLWTKTAAARGDFGIAPVIRSVRPEPRFRVEMLRIDRAQQAPRYQLFHEPAAATDRHMVHREA